jgi:hypothetical protein
MSEFEIDDSQISTKELLKQQRKAAYEKKKAEAKAEKVQAKLEAKELKEKLRAEIDRQLWDALKPASALEEKQ